MAAIETAPAAAGINGAASDLIAELRALVGEKGIVAGDDVGKRAGSWYGEDHRAAAIVRPADTASLSAVLAACSRHRAAVVVQGGLTGQSGGATAQPGEVAISLDRLRAIEEIDATNCTMTIGAGATLLEAQLSAAYYGLFLAPDWGARGSATIGGGIATNGGGTNVLRYGMMRDHVLGLEVVLADGTIISSLNKLVKNNTGFDLKQLFIGSEGTLGVITKAVLRLHVQPSSTSTALIGCGSLEQTLALLAHLRKTLGPNMTSFEVMWDSFFELVVAESGHARPLDAVHNFYILAESRGFSAAQDEDQFAEALSTALEAGLVENAAICSNATQRSALWALRDDVDALRRALHPMITFDISLGIDQLGAYLSEVEHEASARFPELQFIVFGHLGDGNIHICCGIGEHEAADRASLSAIIYRHVDRCSGSISAEHGIGVDKRAYIRHSRNSSELALMWKLKETLDPANILNPGRVLPPREETDGR